MRTHVLPLGGSVDRSASSSVPVHRLERRPPGSDLYGREAQLADIAARYSDRPDLSIQHGGGVLVIMPTGSAGFPIAVDLDNGKPFADFGGCRQDFDTVDQIAYCIDLTLAGAARLRVDYRNGKPFCWTLDEMRHGAPRLMLSCAHPGAGMWSFRRTITSREFAYPNRRVEA